MSKLIAQAIEYLTENKNHFSYGFTDIEIIIGTQQLYYPLYFVDQLWE